VVAFDPAIASMPDELRGHAELAGSLREAVTGAEAIWVATAWPQFRELPQELARAAPSGAVESVRPTSVIVLDPARWLEGQIGSGVPWKYFTVGSGL
jgi:hypothetical protein